MPFHLVVGGAPSSQTGRAELVTRAVDLVKQRIAETQDPNFRALPAQIVAAIDEVVASRRLSIQESNVLKADIVAAVIGQLGLFLRSGSAAAEAGKALTVLQNANEISRIEEAVLRGFSQTFEPLGGVRLSSARRSVRGLGGMAASFGCELGHDSWVRQSSADTVEGDRAVDVGRTGVRARPTMMPYGFAKGLTDSSEDNEVLRQIHRENSRGTADAFSAVLKTVATFSENAEVLQPSTSEMVERSEPAAFFLPGDFLAMINSLGAELRSFRQYVSRGLKAPEDQFAILKTCLGEIHKGYLGWSDSSSEYPLSFEELTPIEQSRNVPALLGALHGLLEANRIVGEILTDGLLLAARTPSDGGIALQLHLFSTASRAEGEESPAKALELFSRAAADVAALSMAHRYKWLPQHAAEKLPELHNLVREIATEAGEAYILRGKPGLDEGAGIALKRFGELLDILEPSREGLAISELQRKAESIIRRANPDDVVAFCQKFFFVGEMPEGPALRSALEDAVDPNDWFIRRLASLQFHGGESQFSDEEMKSLYAFFVTAGSEWIVNQPNRATLEGDYSRSDPYSRDRTFNPYDLVVAGADSNVMSVWVVLKDLFVLQDALPPLDTASA